MTLVSNGITAGVGGGNYGVDQGTKRQQMAVFLLKAKHGLCYVPPPCTGAFPDVPCPSIRRLDRGPGRRRHHRPAAAAATSAPKTSSRARQMAVFLLKSKYGSSYVPPACTGVFDDVPCPGLLPSTSSSSSTPRDHRRLLGHSAALLPRQLHTRGQMAVFIVKTFGLQ